MELETLDRPTVTEMIALLQKLPPDMPFRISDPDTGWTIHQIEVSVDDGNFWLTGSYCDMNHEEKMPPRATGAQPCVASQPRAFSLAEIHAAWDGAGISMASHDWALFAETLAGQSPT